jgi:hypothetical protein
MADSDESLDMLKAELEEMKADEALTWETDVLKRTVAKLLAVEKQAIYGSVTGKKKKIENIINSEYENYEELSNEN